MDICRTPGNTSCGRRTSPCADVSDLPSDRGRRARPPRTSRNPLPAGWPGRSGLLIKSLWLSLRATAGSAAISYCMSPNELRLPRRYDTSVFAPRNDGSRGSSTSPFVRVSLLEYGRLETRTNVRARAIMSYPYGHGSGAGPWLNM